MLRLLLVFLILRCAAVTSEDTEASGDEDHVDEEFEEEDVFPQDNIPNKTRHLPVENAELDKSQGEEEETSTDGTMIIIIAAASVVALAIFAIGGIILFRRYLRSQEQGVYSMPAEQGQKAAV